MTLLINEVWIIFPTPGIWFVLFDDAYEKQFLTHASMIAAKVSRVMPYLGRSLLIKGKNALMMYKVDATR